jgi:competence protein ComEC
MWRALWIVGLGLCIGIVVGDAGVAVDDAGWCLGFGAACAGLVCVVRRKPVVLLLALGVLWFCVGASRARPPSQAPPRPTWLAQPKEALRFEGRIVSPPVRAYGRTTLVVDLWRVFWEARWRPVRVRARVHVRGLAFHLALGDAVVGRARFGPPRILSNPGAFDVARALRYEGIALAASAELNAIARRIDVSPDGTLWPRLDALRAGTVERLGQGALGEGGLVSAMSLGDRGGLTFDDRDAFATTGIAHAVAVSGQHLVIVAFLFFHAIVWLLARVPAIAVRVAPRRVGAVATFLVALAYTLLTGAPYSAVRALVMTGFFLLAAVLGRPTKAADTLCVGVTAIVVASPGALFDVGFQLSLAAVAGLLWVTPPIAAWLESRGPAPPSTPHEPPTRRRRVWVWAGLVVAATLGATLVTAPVVAHYFHRLTPLGILGSLVVVPLLEIWVLPVSIAALILPIPGDGLWHVAEAGAWLSRRAIDGLLELDFLTANVTPPSTFEVACWMGVALLVPWLRKRAARVAAMLMLCVLAVSVGASVIQKRFGDRLEIHFLSVGHGDAALVRCPGGTTVLVDGGGSVVGSYDVGRLVLLPALRSLGVSQIDAMVLSHPHPDHAGGLAAVLSALEVRELWTNGRPFGTGASALAKGLVSKRPVRREFRAGAAEWGCGPARIEVLHPLTEPDDPQSYFDELGENDNSLVLRIRYGRFVAIFAGDLEAEGEHLFIERTARLDATLVKAPHHGSRTSSTAPFVDATRPRIVVFSAGEGSPYGFPHAEVVERWRAVGASTFRTDADGAVHVSTDGSVVEVRSRRSGRGLSFELPPADRPARNDRPPPAETRVNPTKEGGRDATVLGDWSL